MIAKLGFVLIVLLFGVLMFAAGMLAPDRLRLSVQSGAEQLLKPDAAATSTTANAEDPDTTAQTEQTEDTSAAEPEPLPYETLLVPSPLPDPAQFALQIGLYTDSTSTDTLNRRITALGYPTQIIPVIDGKGLHWLLLAAGEYASADEARAARGPLSRDLGNSQPLTLILLPPPPPKT